MVHSEAATVDEYLADLPADRRADIETVRDVVLANLPAGYEERRRSGSATPPVARSWTWASPASASRGPTTSPSM
jgi:hypothetical protein